jgi:sulfonate transport system substrate-binding protein
MNMTRIVAKLALIFAVLAGALPAKAENLPETIRFGGFGQGFGQPYGVALLAIAQVKGFIADEFKGTPVKFTYQYFTGTGPAINEAIANDQLDFAQYGGLPNIIGKAAGLPTRIIASYGQTAIFGLARPQAGIASIKDLRGKKVAVTKGTILHWALLKALVGSGLTLRDITLVDLKSADQTAALAAGNIDAVIGSSTQLVLVEKGAAKVFYSSKETGPKTAGFGAITVTEKFEHEYPEATQRVANALVRAAHWLAQDGNAEEALDIWTKSGVRRESLISEFEGVSLKDVFNPRVDAFLISQYGDAAAFTKEQKLIRADIDLPKWFAPQYVERAIAGQKLQGFWKDRNAQGLAALSQ